MTSVDARALTTELLGIVRHFGVFERESVCCGTVTVPQCLVLQQLFETASDMTSLAAGAGASVSAMTRLVDGLERRGWIERTRDDQDRRRVLVALTEAGRQEANKLRLQTEVVVAAVLEHIPMAEREQVLASLRTVGEAMTRTRKAFADCCGPSSK